MAPVLLGEVIGVFGIRGELRLLLYHREGTTLAEPRVVELVTPSGRRSVRLSTRSGAGKRVLGRIEGVDTPEAAAALVGARIEVERSSLAPAAPGEFYVYDLVGLEVIDGAGTVHGRITDVVAGDQDVWVLDEGAAFVVASKASVESVDVEGGVVRVAVGAVETG